MQYRKVQVIGGRGEGPDRFRAELQSVAVDSRGRIYAAGDSEIKVFDAAGAIARRWSTAKPPLAVAPAADGSVYVGEAGQIEIFSNGRLIDTWRNAQLLGRVTAIRFTEESVLAGDASDRAIRRLDRHGKLLNTIGKDNPVNGLLIPNGVVDLGVDGRGVIHAANPGKHRVEQYAADGRLLGHIGRFNGTDPAGFTGCCNPTNVAVGECLYTAEKAGPRVKAYDFSGRLLAVIAGDAFDANCKNMSIAVDARRRLYVADTVKLAILVFEEVAG
jgi:sugar lactone lactonase YvrE